MEIDFGLRFVHKLVVVRLAPVERNSASKKRVGAWDNQDINSSGETEFFLDLRRMLVRERRRRAKFKHDLYMEKQAYFTTCRCRVQLLHKFKSSGSFLLQCVGSFPAWHFFKCHLYAEQSHRSKLHELLLRI